MKGMTPDLSDEEKRALGDLLKRTIDKDRYPLSLRILRLKAILAKLDPQAIPHSDRRSRSEAVQAAARRPHQVRSLRVGTFASRPMINSRSSAIAAKSDRA
jgi:hypothetical protein